MRIHYTNIAEQHKAMKHELLAAVGKVLDSGRFILGDETKIFEENFSKLIGARYAIGVNSGTDALFLALKALGIKQGDEVITVSNSFLSTATSIAHTGATPVFVDVKENYLIDENLIEDKITDKTKVILPVHLTGRPCNMDTIMKIAGKHEIHVVEDCAQAVMAEWNSKKVGSFGIGCFSLHPLKTLSACGDGGVMTTNDGDLYAKLMQLRNIGLKNRNESDVLGFNSRLDDLHASILNIKLKHLEKWTEGRRNVAEKYFNRLQELKMKGINYIPRDHDKEYAVYHTFILNLEERDKFVEFLWQNGIEAKIHYPIPIHRQKCFSHLNISDEDLPNTSRQAKQIISLPSYQELSDGQIDFICSKIREFYAKIHGKENSVLHRGL